MIKDEISVKIVGYAVQTAPTSYRRLSGLSTAHIHEGGKEVRSACAGSGEYPLPHYMLPSSPCVLCGESRKGALALSLQALLFDKEFWGGQSFAVL